MSLHWQSQQAVVKSRFLPHCCEVHGREEFYPGLSAMTRQLLQEAGDLWQLVQQIRKRNGQEHPTQEPHFFLFSTWEGLSIFVANAERSCGLSELYAHLNYVCWAQLQIILPRGSQWQRFPRGKWCPSACGGDSSLSLGKSGQDGTGWDVVTLQKDIVSKIPVEI